MKTLFKCFVLVCFVFCGGCADSGETSKLSGRAFYVDPVNGDDSNNGLGEDQAWKTFANVNNIQLKAGDKVNISAGSFDQTLKLSGSGTAGSPVEVVFAPGRYDLYTNNITRRKYNISNTNGSPDDPKAVGILFDKAKHFKVSGAGANIVCRGKMIEVCVDGSEDITVEGLSFDYHRPTVVEYTPVEVTKDYIDLKVHKDSVCKIDDEGKLTWHGEGWSFGTGLGQVLDLSINHVRRMRSPLAGLTFEEIKPGLVRGRGRHRMKKGLVYQIRDPFRDCAGVFTRRSKNITWKNVHFKFLHGMGLVNQFSENLTFDKVRIAPDKDSGRTTAAWADGIQVSGCRGKVLVKDCVFSGAHDDAINIHGTHLRVVEKIGTHQVKVRFIHKQTYGFLAFNPGDEITFVRWDSLATYAPNKVKDAKLLNPTDILLTLEKAYPDNINEKDVIENVTWTPEVEIRGCVVSRIPTRGFLITTRRKVVVEKNVFNRTHMSAILLEDDAAGWFESGCIRDMTIRGNTFNYCAEPVVNVNPRNTVPNDSVHQNIRVFDNKFLLRGKLMLRAKSTKGLTIKGNTVIAESKLDDETAIKTTDCSDVTVKGNVYLVSGE